MSASEDAKAIRKAIQGLGTDDAKLVEIITHRTNEQLVAITAEYTSAFGKSIFEDIKGDTSGNYRDLLLGLVESKANYIAHVVHNAVKGAGTNEDALIDALCHTPNALLRSASEAYRKLFNKGMADDVADDTSGDFKQLLVGILSASRDESNVVNAEMVRTDVDTLYKKGEGRLGTDEDAFIQFFLQRNFAHIAEVNRVYAEKHGHDLVAAVNSEFSGSIRRALKALAQTRADYWASRIYKALIGLGTNDSVLVRAFVLNNRDQIRAVEVAYVSYLSRKKGGKKPSQGKEKKEPKKEKKEKKDKPSKGSLVDDIQGDTSGWYEKTLLALLR